MILGFLGKGGSGKSTLATQMALHLRGENKSVLAIDADHNMDLSYNLSHGTIPPFAYISQSLKDLQETVGLQPGEKYNQAFLKGTTARFTLSPLSKDIQSYSILLDNEIRLMAAGPQTDNVLYGTHCSHSLTTSLKILLPLIELQNDEVVVVDEKAGADGVSTGIVTGIDVGVIVCEPAIHSIKTAKQIATLMEFYSTPYVFIGNKIMNTEERDFIIANLETDLVVCMPASTTVRHSPSLTETSWFSQLQSIITTAVQLNQNDRLDRTVRKFKRNAEFASI